MVASDSAVSNRTASTPESRRMPVSPLAACCTGGGYGIVVPCSSALPTSMYARTTRSISSGFVPFSGTPRTVVTALLYARSSMRQLTPSTCSSAARAATRRLRWATAVEKSDSATSPYSASVRVSLMVPFFPFPCCFSVRSRLYSSILTASTDGAREAGTSGRLTIREVSSHGIIDSISAFGCRCACSLA